MVNSCCVIGCTYRFVKGAGISFHRFPCDEKRKALWVQALKRKNWTPSSSSSICGQHFQTGKPSYDAGHPDYVPNVFKFSKEKIRGAESYEKRINRILTAKNTSRTPKENFITAPILRPQLILPGKAAHWTDINNPDWVPTKNIESKTTTKSIEAGVFKQEKACIGETVATELEIASQETPDPISEEVSTSSILSRTEETIQDYELQNSFLPSNLNSNPETEVPSKRPRVFYLCKRTSPKRTFTMRSSTKATEVLTDDSRNSVENDGVKSVYEEIEHKLRVERLHRQIELVQKKIDVQNKLLEMLDNNPGKLNLKF